MVVVFNYGTLLVVVEGGKPDVANARLEKTRSEQSGTFTLLMLLSVPK
jgi:hypothetical protein